MVQRSSTIRDRRNVFFAGLVRRVEQNQLGFFNFIHINFTWEMEDTEQVRLELAAARRNIRIVSEAKREHGILRSSRSRSLAA